MTTRLTECVGGAWLVFASPGASAGGVEARLGKAWRLYQQDARRVSVSLRWESQEDRDDAVRRCRALQRSARCRRVVHRNAHNGGTSLPKHGREIDDALCRVREAQLLFHR